MTPPPPLPRNTRPSLTHPHQVVTQAQTISAIQKRYGGALGSLKDDSISKWLEENRPAHLSAAAVADAFLGSLAG